MAAILSRPQWVKEGVCFCMKPSIWYLLTWWQRDKIKECHYSDVIISAMASQITDVSIVYRTACLGADQRKHTKLRLTGLAEENSPVTGEFPAQMASNAENVSIWWRHHGDEWSLWHITQCVWFIWVWGITTQCLVYHYKFVSQVLIPLSTYHKW